MRATAENLAAVKAVMSRIAGRFGGGYGFSQEYIEEMNSALLECPTLAVFRAVSRDLLAMAPTNAEGRKIVPTPFDVARLAREHEPVMPECADCGGSGWISGKRSVRNPCGVGQYEIDAAGRCHCRTVYRPPKETADAGMDSIRGIVGGGQ